MKNLDRVFEGLASLALRCRFQLAGREADYLSSRGSEVVLSHAREFVAKRLAPAEAARDGRQTPFRGYPVFVAQHATATCCRDCLVKWHVIPAGRELADAGREHVVLALARWLDAQGAGSGSRPELPLGRAG